MKLQPVNDPRPGQLLFCSAHERMEPAEGMLADLDGPPFAGYYCPDGAPELPYCGGCALSHDGDRCKEYEVSWTFGGTTTVTAQSDDLAREAFHEMVADAEILDDHPFEPDVIRVDLVSTYCGSIPRDELAAHKAGCGACGSDDAL